MHHRTESGDHLILKVAAFVLTPTPEPMVLALRHPIAGLQFPAGTIESGEGVLDAARREVREETCVTALDQGRRLGTEVCPRDADEGFVLETSESISTNRDEERSLFYRGRRVRILSHGDALSQVCEEEWNLNLDPPIVSRRIQGVIPTRFIGRSVARVFVCFLFLGDFRSEPWKCTADGHTWQVEWIPLRTTERFALNQADWFERFRILMYSACGVESSQRM
ncbi:NUDIX domain-containing protein [Schlesneria paludicola]|uniref:NUDIX domain-containing protein n=1 Tax=Schlesneria paludicola TaxID=360056 RepID=UPI0012FBEB0F|nr:NUDIX domain-containing protein [Schlesneria paludicola]